MSIPKIITRAMSRFQITRNIFMKKDWHNYTQIIAEKRRTGFGEQGRAAKMPSEGGLNKPPNQYKNGLNAALSDAISLNRSLPDVRHPACKKKLYLESLPSVSVIISFNEEHWSTLLRTLYSVLYRSPEQLIQEIILVDDASEEEFLKEKLKEYLKTHMPKAKVLRTNTRRGVVQARLFGAKSATADALVFLDSHVEVNVNWLPPLLEPIAIDYRMVMCSSVDDIDFQSFEYVINEGGRGAFDWLFFYKRLPMLPKDKKKLPAPYENPIMSGGPFAISRVFFWELGGFDPGFQIWGGEQFEFSFKVWQCGGRIMNAPCSRVGHVSRLFTPDPPVNLQGIHIVKNFRRSLDVWMDEYAEYVYTRKPLWRQLDPGDLTEQKALRKKLKCKPFKWFISQIAFDLPAHYPMIEPKPFAEGNIRPILNTTVCVDGHNGQAGERLNLSPCNKYFGQKFFFSWHKDIQLKNDFCWDVPESIGRGAVLLEYCHRNGGNQQWRYNEGGKTLQHKSGTCLDHDPKTLEIFVYPCFDKAKTQQWTIDVINRDQMAKWRERERVTGPLEKWTE